MSARGDDWRKRDAIFAQAFTCIRFALQGWQHEESFSVISEMEAAGEFDDIVLVRERQGKSDFILIQQKHHKDTKFDITDENLMNRQSEFYLIKYFDSYLDIREKFTSTDKEIVGLVIITNKCFANEGDSLEIIEECSCDSFFKNMSFVLLKFKGDIDSRKPWIDYLASNTIHSYAGIEKEAETFLNLLVFASENQSINHQREILIREFNKISWSDPENAYSIFENKMLEKISGCNGEETCIMKNFMNDLFQHINLIINSEMSSQESV